jgi:ferrous-iron efflux pump FieF
MARTLLLKASTFNRSTHPGEEAIDTLALALSPVQAAALMRRASAVAVLTALALVATKAAVYALSGSVVLLASLVDSALDVLASGTNWLAIRWATSPPDAGHCFGHGKAEALSGFAQSVVIAGSASFVAYEAASRLLSPRPLAAGAAALAVLGVSAGATVALVAYLGRVSQATGSLAVRADNLHYQTDLAINLGAALAVAIAAYGGPLWVDGAAGLLIALYVGRSALQIAKSALEQLMDAELDAESRANILRLTSEVSGVRSAHSLRTRKAGPVLHVQLSLELPAEWPLAQACRVADEVRARIGGQYPGADVVCQLLPFEKGQRSQITPPESRLDPA